MPKNSKKGHYINVNIALDAFEMLENHCRVSGQTKTIAIERMIRACYGPDRKISDADIAAAQNIPEHARGNNDAGKEAPGDA